MLTGKFGKVGFVGYLKIFHTDFIWLSDLLPNKNICLANFSANPLSSLGCIQPMLPILLVLRAKYQGESQASGASFLN